MLIGNSLIDIPLYLIINGVANSKSSKPPSSLLAEKIDASYSIPNSFKTSKAQTFSFLIENAGAL